MFLTEKPDDIRCSCICHLAHYDQHAALNVLYRFATFIMPPMPPDTNVVPLVAGADGAMDDMVQESNNVNAPRVATSVSRMWRDVIFPARCAWRNADRVAARSVHGEESIQVSDEECEYWDGIQRQLPPYIREIHAIAVDYEDRDAWAEQVKAADEYLAYCESTIEGRHYVVSLNEIATLVGHYRQFD